MDNIDTKNQYTDSQLMDGTCKPTNSTNFTGTDSIKSQANTASSAARPHEKRTTDLNPCPTLQAVVYNSETEGFELNEQELKDFLFSPELEHQKIALVSIAGAFRKGKSFLLNFFIKYLEYLDSNSTYSNTIDELLEKNPLIDDLTKQNKNNILGQVRVSDKADNSTKLGTDGALLEKENIIDNDDPSKLLENTDCIPDSLSGSTRNINKRVISTVFENSATTGDEEDDVDQNLQIPPWLSSSRDKIAGFKWRGGSERETSGIVIWKKPYFLNTKRHGRVAVILMDTQGTFDWTSTVKNCATIFALSTMLSSVQIFNLSNNIQEDDLNHLQFFTEYGRLALQQSEFKPFQKLLFLVRDWPYRYEFDYGFSPEYLDKILQVNPSQPKELQNVRKHIHECFDDISCMLLPYPGSKVATSLRFKGIINDIETPFLHHVGNLINHTISMYCRQAKEINGKSLTGGDIFYYFKSYMQSFQCNDMPEPKNILMATGEADHLIALKQSQDYYMGKMVMVCGGDQPYMPPNQLNNYHSKYKQKAINSFENSKKMGSEIYQEEFLNNLDEFIEIRYKEFFESNNSKNLLKNVRVFIICSLLFLISLTISQVLDVIGLDWFMGPFVLTARISVVILLFWLYLRITGYLRSSLVVMNEVAELLWQTIFELFIQIYSNSNLYPSTVSVIDNVLNTARTVNPEVTQRSNLVPKASIHGRTYSQTKFRSNSKQAF